MRELLEGRRLGFALRPAAANVILGLGLAVTLLDLMAWFGWGTRETNALVVGAEWLCVAAALVGAFGLATAIVETADAPDQERQMARLDAGAVLGAVLLYAGSAATRALDPGAAAASPPAFLMALAGLVVAGAGAGASSLLYAEREWEEVEDLAHERHRRRRAASR